MGFVRFSGTIPVFAVITAILVVFSTGLAGTALAQGFDFFVIGDAPYCSNDGSASEENDIRCKVGDSSDYVRFDKMRERINQAKPAFTVHIGDIKTSVLPCTEETFARIRAQFNAFEEPLIYTPGDNEWTDCRQPGAGDFRPYTRGRLALLREMFFMPRGTSLGVSAARMKLQYQSEAYPENLRWEYGGIIFATLHAIGSDNNSQDMEEAQPRWVAVADWIRGTFAAAKEARAVVFFTQADPRFESPQLCRGFRELFETLVSQTVTFVNGGPKETMRQVVFVHGDSHLFRVDKPLYVTTTGESKFHHTKLGFEFAKLHLVENFTRVESFGSPEVHAVRIHTDLEDPQIFSFQPVMIPGNFHPSLDPARAVSATPYHSTKCD